MDRILSKCKITLKNRFPNHNSYATNYSVLTNFLKTYNIKSIQVIFRKDAAISQTINNLKKSDSTKKKIFQMLGIMLEKDFKKTRAYRRYMSEYTKADDRIREKVITSRPINDKELEILRMFDLPKLREFKIIDEFTKHDLLYNLYIHQDETPRLSYRSLKYDTVKKTGNYMTKDYYIIINDYKTNSSFGKWKFKLNPKLQKYMALYLKHNNIKRNDYFFVNKHNKPYVSQAFSYLFATAMKHKTGYRITNAALRKLKSNYLFHDKFNRDKSFKQKQDYCIRYFRHTLITAMQYYYKI